MPIRTLKRPGNVRVTIEPKTGMGNGQEFTYGSSYPAYARFTGTKSINLQGANGFTRQDSLTLTFQYGSQFGQIRNGHGEVSELPEGSRITWNGRYYTVVRTSHITDEMTGRFYSMMAILEDSGKAPVAVSAMVVDPRASDQGDRKSVV